MNVYEEKEVLRFGININLRSIYGTGTRETKDESGALSNLKKKKRKRKLGRKIGLDYITEGRGNMCKS